MVGWEGSRLPRFPRVFVEGGVHHVYNRFARGEPIFEGEWEVRRFLSLVREVKERDGLVVFAWSVLSNHFHLALRTGPVPLSRSMRSIQGRFSQAFNILRSRSGPVWQSRYQARLVDGEDHLRRLITYVHLNPVRAGLVEDPGGHRWSGHREIMGRRRSGLADVDDALLVFGETRRSARHNYLRAMEAALAEDGRDCELQSAPWWSRESELKVREDAAHVDILGRSTGLERVSVEPVEYVKLCAELLDIPLTDLQSRRRGESLTRALELVATLGLQRWRQGARALGDVLGIYPGSVGRQAARGARRALEDTAFAARLDDLDRRLASKTAD